MTSIAISTTYEDGGEYAAALVAAGAQPRLLRFDSTAVDEQLDGADGVLLAGGGDVDPRRYGAASAGAYELDDRRDEFELALVRRARERGLATLCICRGLQVANVAFGGTLVVDIGSVYGPTTAAYHRIEVEGRSERGLIAGHQLTIEPLSRLASILPASPVVTGSRHHQCVDRLAPDLTITARTADGIVEALEARFDSPFWLAVQWHPESTLEADEGTSKAIFTAFVAAARGAAAPFSLREAR